jgi:superfamily II DNA or RNA helicase
MQIKSKYINLEINGRLFPSWILANFKKYKLATITKNENVNQCDITNITKKKELRSYQKFVGKYLDYRGIYKNILLYHGMGSGKTNIVINIYNILYEYTSGWNVFILIKATLRDDPWIKDLEEWISKSDYEYRMKNIIFISYDAPNADKQFMDAINKIDISKKSYYIIDEAHNFIRNVYTNINTGLGNRAHIIYDHIIRDKLDNDSTRVILLSATPVINKPFELALLFNLLRHNIFPKSENKFNQLYVSTSGNQKINSNMINTFQRRIIGLVSYYMGTNPELFASQKEHIIKVNMSDYQEDIYNYYEKIENQMLTNKKKNPGSSTYKSYTRQACNFVFPAINQNVTAELRPRPNKFKIKDDDTIKNEKSKKSKKKQKYEAYKKNIELFIDTFNAYLKNINNLDINNKHTINDDINTYINDYEFEYDKFMDNQNVKSKLFTTINNYSPKMLHIIFNIFKSKGPTVVYSNYVFVEGFQIFKIFLKYFDFSELNYNSQIDTYNTKNNTENNTTKYIYCEYHGGINHNIRSKIRKIFNLKDNIYGDIIKIIMISPAGTEGISLHNVRQVHIMEPYWNEVRIKQIIGRAIRQCSHKDLPSHERHVDVFRYLCIKKNIKEQSADEYIYELAIHKQNLLESFLDVIRQVSIDCELFKNHNMMHKKYECFKFNDNATFDDQIGPAYKHDIDDDIKISSGSNSNNSKKKNIKIYKINAKIVYSEKKYSNINEYWYNPDTYIVYDLEFYYPIGKLKLNDDGFPVIHDDIFLIDKLVPIPIID